MSLHTNETNKSNKDAGKSATTAPKHQVPTSVTASASASASASAQTELAALHMTIDGRDVTFTGEERNLLEVIRQTGIHIPTFCYHSELSVYGACRLCIVNVEGRGIVTSCSTKPEPGLVVRTNTHELRELRRTTMELLLANHEMDCAVCSKSDTCRLRELAVNLGIRKVRFANPEQEKKPVDSSSHSLVRNPNKCILCGDCVRYCQEIQGIGAIDFVNRGSGACVQPAFGKDLAKVECVNCGQCAAVCPTAAIIPKSETGAVWKALADPTKFVIAQVAPAVRMAIGEAFGLEPGQNHAGEMVAALRHIGFDEVYDTAFAADLTVIEEGTELAGRLSGYERYASDDTDGAAHTDKKKGPLPLFTSCCPAWVKYAEQYYPTLLPNLSTARSPQQSFGSLLKHYHTKEKNLLRQDVVVVSIMPCTAKKYEAKREEFSSEGVADVDHVITTVELSEMIKEAGIVFTELEPAPFDLPFGFASGAGLIFGNSGGVAQAVVRFLKDERESAGPAGAGANAVANAAAANKKAQTKFNPVSLEEISEMAESMGLCGAAEISGGCAASCASTCSGGSQGRGGNGGNCHHVDPQSLGGHKNPIKATTIRVGDRDIRIAVVHGLKAAGEIAAMAKNGTCPFQVVEVMACPGGCINGAGQPVNTTPAVTRKKRSVGLSNADRVMPISRSQDNPMLKSVYQTHIGEPGGHKAHEMLHTHYNSKKRLYEDELIIIPGPSKDVLKIKVCVGTGCFLRGAQELIKAISNNLDEWGFRDKVELEATFCMELCDRGPNVKVGKRVLEGATLNMVRDTIREELAARKA